MPSAKHVLGVVGMLVVLACGLAAWRATTADGPQAAASDRLQVLEPGVPVSGIPDGSGTAPATDPVGADRGTVTVHVVGPVVRPGVVVLPEGARVADAIAACGGLTAGADSAAVNLARLLVDGEKIDTAEPAAPVGGPAGDPASTSAPLIDLNSADLDQLQELPGVGPVLAGRIVAYRREHGRFGSVDQLQEVPGIGAARLADLAPLVTVGPG